MGGLQTDNMKLFFFINKVRALLARYRNHDNNNSTSFTTARPIRRNVLKPLNLKRHQLVITYNLQVA
jgi:hypothetical protein